MVESGACPASPAQEATALNDKGPRGPLARPGGDGLSIHPSPDNAPLCPGGTRLAAPLPAVNVYFLKVRDPLEHTHFMPFRPETGDAVTAVPSASLRPRRGRGRRTRSPARALSSGVRGLGRR